jgi:hypothetical protein
MKRTIVLLVVLGLSLNLGLTSVTLAMDECLDLESTRGAKVVLGMVTFEETPGDTIILTKDLELLLIPALNEILGNLIPDRSPRPVLCNSRWPGAGGSQFTPGTSKSLNRKNVLLEVWGSMQDVSSGDQKKFSGQLYLMIIPVRSTEDQDPDLALYPFQLQQQELENPGQALMDMLYSPAFEAGVLLANGVKAHKNHQFSLAKNRISMARTRLEEDVDPGRLLLSELQRDKLMQYIAGLEAEILAQTGTQSPDSETLNLIDAARNSRGQ